MSDFEFQPAYGAQVDHEPRVLAAKFGDGYEQVAADGINNDLAVWSLTFTRETSDITALAAQLAGYGATTTFTWTPFGESEIIVRCRRWSRVRTAFGVQAVTAVFEQQATPIAPPGTLSVYVHSNLTVSESVSGVRTGAFLLNINASDGVTVSESRTMSIFALALIGEPIWTNNGDGTATVTFVTNVPSVAGIQYGDALGLVGEPTWTSNGDGTATVTFVTNLPCYAGVTYEL